jgi:predicted RNase H-like HicB family nuclease
LAQRQKNGGHSMKSYVFPVVIEPDEDVWRAYVPELESRGGATWGHTKEEALKNIQEVAQMVIEALLEDGESLPASVTVSDRPLVAVSV